MRIRLALGRRLVMAAVALGAVASTAGAQTGLAPDAGTRDGGGRGDEQPRWTARPIFGDTNVYVLPKGATAFVFELRPTTSRSGSTSTESAYRAEFGLPARFQLGLRASGRTETSDDVIGNIDARALEIRWGLAGWGRVWGNPTLRADWREASRGADVGSIALLLGGGTDGGWRWGTNLAWTQEASGAREATRAWTAGLGYESGRFVSVGVETRVGFTDRLLTNGSGRAPMTREFLVGPTFQVRPVRRMYLTLAPLFGATTSSARARATLLAGWTF